MLKELTKYFGCLSIVSSVRRRHTKGHQGNNFQGKMTIKLQTPNSKTNDRLDEERSVHVLLKQMLVTRIFAATYVGRFYVESMDIYRDVIQIFDDEKELIRDLVIVKRRVEEFYQNAVWPAITGPDEMLAVGISSNYSMWVQLREVAFGSYWFMIEDVSISGRGEVVIQVKVIRNFKSEDDTKEGTPWDLNKTKLNILNSLNDVVTWNNIKESSKFIFLLIMTILTFLIETVHYLLELSLRIFREFTHFVQVCNPVLLKLLDVICKSIGGFYLLIAMMWRGNNAPPPHLLQKMAIEARPPPHLEYRPRPSFAQRPRQYR